RFGSGVHLHDHRALHLAVGEELHGAAVLADQSLLHQHVARDLGGVELGDLADVDNLVDDALQIVEPALGHAPLQRHLAAFEPRRRARPGPLALALVAASAGAADARAAALAAPLRLAYRARRVMQIPELHLLSLLDHHQVAHLVHHAADLRRGLVDHRLLHAL